MGKKYTKQKQLMDEKRRFLLSNGYAGKIKTTDLRKSWDSIYKMAGKKNDKPEKIASKSKKSNRAKELREEKKQFLIAHGYSEKEIKSSDLRKSWENIFKMVTDIPEEGEWYLCVFFGDNTGNTDVSLHRKFYKNLTAEECRLSIADTMSTYSEKGSSGVAGNVIVRRFSSKNQMDFEILSMQAKDYIVIGSGKSWTLTEILRLTAFSVGVCTENNRQPTLDAIKAYVEKDLPNISKDFVL